MVSGPSLSAGPAGGSGGGLAGFASEAGVLPVADASGAEDGASDAGRRQGGQGSSRLRHRKQTAGRDARVECDFSWILSYSRDRILKVPTIRPLPLGPG